jgi:hypothetical protein
MIRFLENAEECQAAWQRHSPHQRAWDEWDLMYAFHDQDSYKFKFLVHETDGVEDGLVPLVHDTSDNSHELFGGCYPDGRVLWIRPEHFAEIHAALPEPTMFFDLKGCFVERLLMAHPQFEANFAEHDQRWHLVPEKFGWDFYNHIQTFSSEKRKGFLYDLRKVQEKNLEKRWSDDDESDAFIELVNRNFGAESDYVLPAGQAELKRVITELRESGWLRTLVITVDGVKQAVSMSAHYADTLIALYSSSNNDIKNLGKLLNVETIQEGCRLRVAEISYMTGMGWKAAWKMDPELCRSYHKPPKPAAAEPAAP